MEYKGDKISMVDEIRDHPAIELVRKVSNEAGFETYVVGGYVRDLLLKRSGKDIDFVTVGSGVSLAEHVGKESRSKVSVFKNFGTAMLKWKDFELEFVGHETVCFVLSDQTNKFLHGSTFTIELDAVDLEELDNAVLGLLDLDLGRLAHLADFALANLDHPPFGFA